MTRPGQCADLSRGRDLDEHALLVAALDASGHVQVPVGIDPLAPSENGRCLSDPGGLISCARADHGGDDS